MGLVFFLPKFSLQCKPNSIVIDEMVEDLCQKYFSKKKIPPSREKEYFSLEQNLDDDKILNESYIFPLEDEISDAIERRLYQIKEGKILNALIKEHFQEILHALIKKYQFNTLIKRYPQKILDTLIKNYPQEMLNILMKHPQGIENIIQYIHEKIEESKNQIKNILIDIEKENMQRPLTKEEEKNIAHDVDMDMRKSLISIKNKMGEKISLVSNPWFFCKKAEEEVQWMGARLPNHDFHITILRSNEMGENEKITKERYAQVLKILLTDTLNNHINPKLNFLDFSSFTVLFLKEFFLNDVKDPFKLHISLLINPKKLNQKNFHHFIKENEENSLHVNIYKYFQNYILDLYYKNLEKNEDFICKKNTYKALLEEKKGDNYSIKKIIELENHIKNNYFVDFSGNIMDIFSKFLSKKSMKNRIALTQNIEEFKIQHLFETMIDDFNTMCETIKETTFQFNEFLNIHENPENNKTLDKIIRFLKIYNEKDAPFNVNFMDNFSDFYQLNLTDNFVFKLDNMSEYIEQRNKNIISQIDNFQKNIHQKMQCGLKEDIINYIRIMKLEGMDNIDCSSSSSSNSEDGQNNSFMNFHHNDIFLSSNTLEDSDDDFCLNYFSNCKNFPQFPLNIVDNGIQEEDSFCEVLSQGEEDSFQKEEFTKGMTKTVAKRFLEKYDKSQELNTLKNTKFFDKIFFIEFLLNDI